MKLQLKTCSAFSILSLTFCGAFLVPDTGWSRPPEGVERVGNFFYRITRKLERSDQPVPQRVRRTTSTTRYQATPSPDTTIRRPQLGSTTPPNSRVWDPYSQQWVPARSAPQSYAYYDGRTSAGAVNIPPPPSQPAMPGVRLQARPGGVPPVMRGDTWYIDPAAAEAAAAEAAAADAEASAPTPPPTPQPTTATAPAKPAVPQGPVKYGTLVPGKPGFVYPPGVEQETKQMLDVRGLSAGQKVRDPRTGQIFLVP